MCIGAYRTPLRQATPSITPAKFSSKLTASSLSVLSTSSSRRCGHRSPSDERCPSSVGAKGPRKDTRPLSDKAYQMLLLKKIDEYFYVNKCSAMLNSNGSLKPITLKMFVEVSNFLLKYLDGKHDVTMANYIDELPKCAKKLHYPGMITKSWLKTANAMHSWPYVLGWIGWLVEVCQVRDSASNRYHLETLPFIGTEQEAQSSNMEFQALLECYRAYVQEKVGEEEEIVERYFQNILVQQGITDDAIDQTHKELEEEEKKLQVHDKESQKLDTKIERLQQEFASLRVKESKQLNDVTIMQNYIKQTTAETNQLNAEREVLTEQIQIGREQYEELSSIVQNQSMSKTEKEIIVKKCTEIQNYIYQFDEHLKDFQKECYTLDIKLASLSQNLNKAILAYNKEVFMHTDNDFVNFDELKLPENGLLDPIMMELMEEKAAMIIEKKEMLKQKNKTESLIREMKADMKKKKIKIIEKIENIKTEIKKMHDMMPDIKTMDLEIEEAEDKLQALMRRKTFLEQTARHFFSEFYELIGNHRRELHNILTRDRTN